jgi:hypothetical protein
MNVNGITNQTTTYTPAVSPKTETPAKEASVAEKAPANDTGVIYEPSNTTQAAPAKKYAPNTELINKIKEYI